jgi:fermentation-respiration switch protein FrsA (DUF1100 family)
VARLATPAGRHDVTFESGGERCAAWLFRPPAGHAQGDGDVPCVVLAHGWSGIREQRLDAYAERFAAAGMAALVFDYRHFGHSAGEPRQLLDIPRELEDWGAAVAYARALDGVDPDRIALWGTSFSGGHVVTTAAGDPRLAAVVAQVPFADGLANLVRLGKRHALVLTREGLRDQLRAVMNSPDAEPGFHALTPPGVEWPNATAARICLRVTRYRPIRLARQVRCPILFAIAENDLVTPPDLAERAAGLAPRGEVHRYPAGHFDVYVGELFERVVADQVDFLSRHLLARAATGPVRAPARA